MVKTVKNWEYGNAMLKQGDIASLEEWSDDKEYCCSIMVQEFDYLWDFDKGIHFIDRLYSDYEEDDIYADYLEDDTLKERIDKGEAELWFNSFDEVREFIKNKRVAA